MSTKRQIVRLNAVQRRPDSSVGTRLAHDWLQTTAVQMQKRRLMAISQNISILTLKCVSIGTPKIINFPFVSNGKLIFHLSQMEN